MVLYRLGVLAIAGSWQRSNHLGLWIHALGRERAESSYMLYPDPKSRSFRLFLEVWGHYLTCLWGPGTRQYSPTWSPRVGSTNWFVRGRTTWTPADHILGAIQMSALLERLQTVLTYSATGVYSSRFEPWSTPPHIPPISPARRALCDALHYSLKGGLTMAHLSLSVSVGLGVCSPAFEPFPSSHDVRPPGERKEQSKQHHLRLPTAGGVLCCGALMTAFGSCPQRRQIDFQLTQSAQSTIISTWSKPS